MHRRSRSGNGPRPLSAQQGPLPIIGVLDIAAATTLKLSRFYEGLKVEGFSRSQNLTVEYHSAEGDYARLPELAADLVNRRVTLITLRWSSRARRQIRDHKNPNRVCG